MNIKTRLDPEIHAAAKIAAAKQGLSLTEYLRRLVETDLAARKLTNGGAVSSQRGNRNLNSDNDRIR